MNCIDLVINSSNPIKTLFTFSTDAHQDLCKHIQAVATKASYPDPLRGAGEEKGPGIYIRSDYALIFTGINPYSMPFHQ